MKDIPNDVGVSMANVTSPVKSVLCYQLGPIFDQYLSAVATWQHPQLGWNNPVQDARVRSHPHLAPKLYLGWFK